MKYNKLLSILFTVSFVFTLLLTTVSFYSFNNNFYESEFSKLNTATRLKTNNKDLFSFTKILLDYTSGSSDSMVAYATIDNQEREVWTEQEYLHMKDVRDLYLNSIIFRNVMAFIMVLSLGLFLIFYRNQASVFFKVSLKTMLYLFSAFFALAFYIVLDFNAFWTNFHQVFFDNDLWLFDPNNSILVNLVNEQFFFDLVTRIVVTLLIIIIIYLLVAKKYSKEVKK